MKMILWVLLTFVFTWSLWSVMAMEGNEITPYKYKDNEQMPGYNIPPSSRFTTKRVDANAPDIVYYVSKPQGNDYPIVIMCGGSTGGPGDITSIIHFHRYFLKELRDDLELGVVTVEQWGVDGNKVDAAEFMKHYTRSQRLKDHQTVIKHLISNPPVGWNIKFVFFGVSEGGPLVTTLTEDHSAMTLATINWSGAGDWSWREELWAFCQVLLKANPDCQHQKKLCDCPICSGLMTSRQSYDGVMNEMLKNPTSEKNLMNMTYLYHADALRYPLPHYEKIKTPLLVVTGAQDSFVPSSDAFVQKAKEASAPVTYLRVEDMDHYVRKRPDVIKESFDWLRKYMGNGRADNK